MQNCCIIIPLREILMIKIHALGNEDEIRTGNEILARNRITVLEKEVK